MDNFKMDYYPRYKKKWFNIKIRNGVYDKYTKINVKIPPGAVGLYSVKNNIYFFNTLTYFPKLTQTEEILIARIYIFVEVRQIKG
jgi:hypothetical protein